MLGFVPAVAACMFWVQGPAQAASETAEPEWVGRMQAEFTRIETQSGAGLGVYVRDLGTGHAASHRAEETWYLASTVKVPIAIAVLRGVDRGDYRLDTRLVLRDTDLVDGAGQTVKQHVGAPLSIRYLLNQMIVYSDNTASDMLIGLVGIDAVNAVVHELVPQGFQRITTLADVRRHAYENLAPEAARLSGYDFLLLKAQRTDAERQAALSHLIQVPTAAFRLPSVGAAFEAYYATGLNSGRLDAYADLLELLARGKALSAGSTKYLLGVMERVRTGPNRIKAGLPPRAHFAHKTGTQRARTCDSGVVTLPRLGRDQRVVVVACTSGELSSTRSDHTLRQVGTALCKSGLLTDGKPDEPICFATPSLVPGTVAD
ncbi:serine hydrolase [Rhodoferax koreense]|uniref:beta-lactamase n=1 Tax=Rhodoferax koreensis TaxID=1842727 RepID=A0A1P8JQ59_9BURK|nr:serine hydrolase [Rhodoferax koreense]